MNYSKITNGWDNFKTIEVMKAWNSRYFKLRLMPGALTNKKADKLAKEMHSRMNELARSLRNHSEAITYDRLINA